jgi:hypothetical protein
MMDILLFDLVGEPKWEMGKMRWNCGELWTSVGN